MKIICTNEEKQALLNSYESNTELYCCLARPFIGCTSMYETCRECLEKNIEWEIKEKVEME